MQYKHATFLLFVILIGTGILTIAVFERRQALEKEAILFQDAIEQVMNQEDTSAIDRINATTLTANEYRLYNGDLDGDGAGENVSIRLSGNTEVGITATITVNGVSDVSGGNSNLGTPDGYFGIVDIDTADNRKEIAVGFNGPDGQKTTVFYHWNNGALTKFGTKDMTVGGWEQTSFPGDGFAEFMTRALVLDTWFYNAKYQLEGDELVEVPQDFYARLDNTTFPITALVATTLQASPTNAKISMTLAVNETATILGCDHVEVIENESTWCKLEDGAGHTGWFNADTTNWQNTFTGFSFAD